MDKQWSAAWVTEPIFAGLQPIDPFHKEMDGTELPPHQEELKNRHTLARKTFQLNETVNHAVLDISADDYYKLYINGQFVGQGPAQGPIGHYPYNRYEVSGFLHKGVNVIAVHVYYQGLICRAYNSGDYRHGLIAELTADGRPTVATDSSWKLHPAEEYASGGIIGYDTQYLEQIDNRLKQLGWKEPGFDDSAWYGAVEAADGQRRLFLQSTPPLAVYGMKPRRIDSLGEEGFLIDFGEEITGQFTMKARGGEGHVVEIRCGEELLDDGRVRYDMRCNCAYRELWTLSGKEDELELYDYKAFRYAEVLAPSGVTLYPDSFGAVVRHYPLDEDACSFESSDPMLNAIWSICRNGVKYGAQENYVDCPSREKGQYLGDNTVITHAHAYLSGDLRLFRKSLHDFALSAATCPGLMAVAPGHLMQEIADFSFQWPMQLLEYYRQSGDLEFVRDMHPVAVAMLHHFDKYRREDGLLAEVADKWNLVDWPVGMRDDYAFPLNKPVGPGCHNVINAFYYGAMIAVRDLEDVLGIADRTVPEERLASFRRSFRKAFRSVETMLFVDAEGSRHASLHANALPLLFGLTAEEDRPAAVDLLRAKRLSCGVYFSYFVLKALAAAGEHKLVYELIRAEDLHSWGNMVKEGATTCFEAWSKELKWNTSLCHPWASAPIPLLIEEIVGLKPASPGWQTVSFQPRLPEALEHIELAFRTPAGRILFSYKDGKTGLTLPEGVRLAD
ncbi:family 78 glycoside hydrolase catalytic domain [Paenibacillus sp. MBLB4367]|uniref:family 78 glycoside hydrolase catalytic domain n=1 Tax=Paenibacillus sp. MBLB4367 TaxID=3384767 RepID=UPI0039083338